MPETGRRQINFIPPAEEMQLGLTSFDKMKMEVPISTDPAANAPTIAVFLRCSWPSCPPPGLAQDLGVAE